MCFAFPSLTMPTTTSAFTHALNYITHMSHLDSDCLSSPSRHCLSLSDGSEDQLDRLQQVELARMTPMSQWRAGTVQAWLEVVMAMPMYIRTCTENVKSGKVGLNRWHDAGGPTFQFTSYITCNILIQLVVWRTLCGFSCWTISHFAGFTWTNRWRPGAGFRCQQCDASPETAPGHWGLQRCWER